MQDTPTTLSMQPLSALFPLLREPKKIFVTAHVKPDGDAAGSTLGLMHHLRGQGHDVTVVFPSALPDFLEWLPGAGETLDFEESEAAALKALAEADLIYCLDFNDPSRTRLLEPHLRAAAQPKVLIDHHMFPADVWQYGESNASKSSTCEMVYDYILAENSAAEISRDTATCLYTGAMTDTGSFRFSATTPDVHRMIARLMESGINHPEIHESVNDAWSENRMRFVGYMLLERMEIFPEWNAGVITISKADMKLFGISTGDTEGLVQYPLAIRGIRFATLITERGDEVRLSFRSKGDFDVNYFARTYFSGGGHFNASGGKSTLPFNETVLRFKTILSEFHPS